MRIITDQEITNYLTERKYIEKGSSNPPKLLKKSRSYRKTQKIFGISGTEYLLTIRKSIEKENNFCIILSLALEEKVQFILIRYNGNWHKHKNKIEKNRISGFHIHITTERYQRAGYNKDGYAEVTNTYSDWEKGYRRMLQNLNILSEEDKGQRKIIDRY